MRLILTDEEQAQELKARILEIDARRNWKPKILGYVECPTCHTPQFTDMVYIGQKKMFECVNGGWHSNGSVFRSSQWSHDQIKKGCSTIFEATVEHDVLRVDDSKHS